MARRLDSLPPVPICDFCGKPEPVWAYPCHDFEIFRVVTERGNEANISTGEWSACEACADCIEANDIGALLSQRQHFIGRLPPMTMLALIELWGRFFENRDGERFRVTAEFRQDGLPRAVGSRILAQAQIDRADEYRRKRP